MDRSFSDPAALQEKFGIPVVGTIPKAPGNNRRSLLTYALKRPASALMEAVRDMRTSLMLSGQGSGEDGARNGTVLVMTSSIPSEGKTTSSILLAVNSAALKKKVLLIECDLRRSTFQSYFGRPTKLGLVEAIDANEGWEQAIWTEPQTNADIVFGGGKSQGRNAADIFASNDFANFIALMRTRYDLVILDSPPVLPVPDARLIAKLSDKIVYVVRSGTTPASTVAAGLRLFENIGMKVDGLNLTQMRSGSGGYGYGYGYSGYHQGGSKYYQN
jgi:capsular exopolysaccharide synthesis family protein